MERFTKCFGYAFTGIRIAFKSERNFRIHIIAMCLAVALGLYLGLSLPEWGFVIFSIGFVLAAELFNTALEKLGDEVAPDKQNQMVRNAKDISAAAVLLSALTAFVIGVLFLLIPFIRRIFELLQNH